jgi:soluble lytic murein transglycosylase-like protein
MNARPITLLFAVLLLAAPAHAELVYFHTGRALSVRAVRSDGDLLILMLRGGGEVACTRESIARVAPDEVEHPEDAVPATRADAALPIPEPYEDLVAAAARKHGVDARLVHAVIQVESAYRTRAVSPKGARGLMQLLPSTGRQYGALDLFDPAINVDAGVRHLKALLTRFDLPVALAAYNAGEGAVSRFGGIPPFRETRSYVTRVLGLLGLSSVEGPDRSS